MPLTAPNDFAARHVGPRADDLRAMLATLGYDDLDRATAQQSIMNGIKDRITSPLRLPYNFLKGPIIGWTAPRAFISDMGLLEMPQLALSSIFAGSPKPDVLIPSGPGPGGSLEIPVEERQRAVAALEG